MSAARPRKRFDRELWRARGQGLVEYAMILVMVAIVVLVMVAFIGQIVSTEMYSRISSGFPNP